MDFFKQCSIVPNFLIKQNVIDRYHHTNHCLKIVDKLACLDDRLIGDYSFVFYSNEKGHSGVPIIGSLRVDEAAPALIRNRTEYFFSNDSFFRIVPMITEKYISYEFRCVFDKSERVWVRFTHNPEKIMGGVKVHFSETVGSYNDLKPEQQRYQFYFDRESDGDLFVSGWFSVKEVKVII